jgi:glyoxylase-like metal-dependent hydrolase (beta-lactamase superfamily II)
MAATYGVVADFSLHDGDAIQVGAHPIQVVHTPGHTQGSVCLRFDERALVGDSLFPGGPGHTNTPAELEQSLASLHRAIFTWPDDTRCYPGHGRPTSVGQERAGFQAFLARPRPPDLCGDVSWQT